MLDLVRQDLDHHVVGDRIGVLGGLRQFLIDLDGALLALDVLVEQGLGIGVLRRLVAAVGHLVPLLGADGGRAPQLDDAQGQHLGVAQFLRGVLEKFGRHRLPHRPLGQLGPHPVLVIGQPLVGKGLVQQFDQFLHVHSDDRTTFRAHCYASSTN